MAPETLNEDEYIREVQTQADYVVEAMIDYPDDYANVFDALVDVLDGHDWYGTWMGAAFHGSVIEHAKADPYRFTDLYAHIEGQEASEIVEEVSYAMFEADVIEAASEQLEEVE